MKFKNNITSLKKQTPEEVREAIRFGMGVKQTKDIDLNYSAVEDCFSLYFPSTKTRLYTIIT